MLRPLVSRFVAVNQHFRLHAAFMVGGSVQQNLKTRPVPSGNRDCRHPQHFRQAVQINFQPPLLDNIHHV